MIQRMEIDDKTLRKVQLVQLEILDAIDNLCKKNNIKYSLYAGTLLGAVRHGGFIPWDDDLDICMSRRDYVRFIRLWNRYSPQGYILQNKSLEPDFTQSFSKIRKRNTTFLEEGAESGNYHKGIFVDIFPIDRIPNGVIQRKIFRYQCMLYQLYTREFIPVNSNLVVKFCSKIILNVTPKNMRKYLRKQLQRHIVSHNKDEKLNTIAIETYQTLSHIFPVELLDEYVELQFEGKKYMCFKLWNEYLTLEYGNYMELPPKEERIWKHRPLIIDFQHEYK